MTQLTVVGVGPGPSDLITLRGLRAIQNASALMYVCGSSQRSRALSVVQQYICESTQLFDIPLAMSSDSAVRQRDYLRAGKILSQVLSNHQHDCPVLLCLGDPCFYGSWVRIVGAGIDQYKGRCDVAVVPGVSSPALAFATMAQPMALDDQQIRFVTGKAINDITDFSEFFADYETIIVFKPATITQHQWQALLQYIASTSTLCASVVTQNPDSSAKVDSIPVNTDLSGNEHNFQAPYFSLIIFQRKNRIAKEIS